MRHSPLRVLPLLLTALVAGAFLGTVAQAGEGERAEAERESVTHAREVVRVLQTSIKALRKLGGNEGLIKHLEGMIARVKHSVRESSSKDAKGRKAGAEKRRQGQMVEVMHMAHQVLREAGRGDQAEVMKHSAYAMKMVWSGRTDEEAMAILTTAPSRERQAHALFQAAELLADQGRERQAKFCAQLGKKLQGKTPGRKTPAHKKEAGKSKQRRKAKKQARGDKPRKEEKVRVRAVDPEHGREGLRERLAILRLAMPALREGERHDAAEMLERALHTAELLLEEREDEEAQKIYRNTPSLEQLARLLHESARLWIKYKQPEKAEAVARLSRYYRGRAAQGRDDDDDDAEEEGEHEDDDAREREEARRARHSTWAVRQQKELDARQRRARAQEMAEQRRREHEQRVRAHSRRDPDAERHEDETSERIDQLRRELQEVQQALQELMRELREIVRER